MKNAMMMNRALDDMDMITGMPTGTPRLPVQALAAAIQGGHTLNNFNISESQIGVLNTGAINKIDAAITLTKGTDAEGMGHHIKTLTEAVLSSDELTTEQKNAIIELTETLSEEVVGQRKPATIKAVLKEIVEQTKGAATITASAKVLWDILAPLFSA
ncbi:hypothetical protein [Thioclava sediminum]|uniref:hypothetical protein n=1 Tax=Thioclava sediminum TaxID=1915319 RepID=UPI00131413B2|nr:hypothetical protein [Thioclava sediminum]